MVGFTMSKTGGGIYSYKAKLSIAMAGQGVTGARAHARAAKSLPESESVFEPNGTSRGFSRLIGAR